MMSVSWSCARLNNARADGQQGVTWAMQCQRLFQKSHRSSRIVVIFEHPRFREDMLRAAYACT
jgi:hypothetical protein